MKALISSLSSVALFTLVGCGGDPAQPTGTGSLVLEIIPVSSQAGDPVVSGSVSGVPLLPSKGSVNADSRRGFATRITTPEDLSCQYCDGPNLSDVARAAPPLDRVEVRLSGQATRNIVLTNSGSVFEGTIENLPVGTYVVKVVGSAFGEATFYGVASNVRVMEDQETTASITFNEFVPVLQSFTMPTTSFVAPLVFPAVSNASYYRVEVANDPGFSDPVSDSIPDNNGWAWFVLDLGTYYVRIRAGNDDIAAGNAAASNVESFTVQADTVSDLWSDGYYLGFSTSASGRVIQKNITMGDRDWYAVDLLGGDVIGVRVLSSSLVPTSNLDPEVVIQDVFENQIAYNDDDPDGNLFESAIVPFPVASVGTYYIGVGAYVNAPPGNTVGHYELVVSINGAAADPVSLRPISP